MQVVEQVQVRHKQDNKSFAHPAICRTLLSKGRLNLISYGARWSPLIQSRDGDWGAYTFNNVDENGHSSAKRDSILRPSIE